MARFRFLAALAALIFWLGAGRAQAGTPVPIVQAFAGISQGNGTLPCANPGGANGCYGIPDGSVAVMPEQIISTVAPSVYYYAVFETASWSGTLSVTFQILEAGAVVQTITANGSASPNSVTMISAPATFPTNNGYAGRATMSITTTATPSAGGPTFTLKSSTTIRVRPPGQPQGVVALLFTGMDSAYCWNPNPVNPCYGVPEGAVVVAPQNILSAPYSASVYTALQTGYWVGTINCTWQLTEAGTVVGTTSSYLGARNDAIVFPNSGIYVNSGYVGPALLSVTCTATSKYGPPETLSGSSVLGIQ